MDGVEKLGELVRVVGQDGLGDNVMMGEVCEKPNSRGRAEGEDCVWAYGDGLAADGLGAWRNVSTVLSWASAPVWARRR